MFTKIGTITIGVSDQGKALDFYVNKLGFEKRGDQPMSETERWLEIALPGIQTHIMLGLRGQSSGDKTGMTGFVLHTDNIEEMCATLKARGVTLTQELTTEPWPIHVGSLLNIHIWHAAICRNHYVTGCHNMPYPSFFTQYFMHQGQ
jgi:lactoylglutathione lyase